MANNFVAKNDFNRGGAHRDHKNDYDRQDGKIELKEMLDEFDGFVSDEESDLSDIFKSFVVNASSIAAREYERSK